jgi:N-acetylglucosaminyldiphosphoundecaprenol N-acetyl-beta-D-mannosaminyltransferase
MVTADGQSIVWASRLLGCAVPERVTGIDFMLGLWSCSVQNGFRVYLLGADQEALEGTVSAALSLGVDVVGFRNGYWSSDEEESVVEKVRAANPDLLCVALPSPRKERFIAEHLYDLGATLAIGVGGAFDVVAGRTKRAPRWMQEAGLEWAYRLIQEPKRMFRRYLLGNIRFIIIVLRARFSASQ